jgi:sec-independent protein translocase protein TatB
MFDLGLQELIVIFLIALLVFGPKKLPELARTMGKWITEVRRGFYQAKSQIETEFDQVDQGVFKDIDPIQKEEKKEDIQSGQDKLHNDSGEKEDIQSGQDKLHNDSGKGEGI